MTSRKSLRQQGSIQVQRKHWLSSFIGVVATVAMLVCLLLNITIFNGKFVSKELANTPLASQIEGQINDSFAAYGLTGKVVNHQQTQKLLNTAINQVYVGETVHLDLSDIVSNVQSKSSDVLQGYQLPAAFSNSIDASVNEIVNSKINSSQLTNIEHNLKAFRRITLITLTISIFILLLVVIYNLFSDTFLRDVRWICLISAFLFWVCLRAARVLITAELANDSTWGPIIDSLVKAIYQEGFYLAITMLVMAAVLFVFSIIRQHKA